ncbi:hypothetical protein [Phenylobacterium sp.]|jgi:hypothetical protein|uniref:hypothetical protein n=1 Tax=Phenylobacterium sp. TaxID=1871053 RepID=UPI003784609A
MPVNHFPATDRSNSPNRLQAASRKRRVTRPAPQAEKAPLPRVPRSYVAEVQAIEGACDALLTKAQEGRRRIYDSVWLDLASPTHARQALAVATDPELAARCLAIRTLGRRLETIGGWRLLEDTVDRLAPEDGRNVELRRAVLRGCWHRLGEFLA